jgi:hypothetical protein
MDSFEFFRKFLVERSIIKVLALMVLEGILLNLELVFARWIIEAKRHPIH